MINKFVMQKDADRPDTESRILQAAEKEFLTKGYAGARTTSIAEAAGVTHAMFHYYFRTKEKLFDRIMTETVSLLKDVMASTVMDSDMSLEDKIRNVIGQHLDFLAANPDMPRFLVGEVFGSPERMGALLDKIKSYSPWVVSQMQSLIDTSAAEGLCRRVDAKMLILDIASLNIFSFMASPLVNVILGGCLDNMEAFLEQRKKENFDTIMRKLAL